MYFVTCYPKEDNGWSWSVNRTTEAFNDLEKAKSFVDIWRNKGYICIMYQGIQLMN